MRRSKKIIVTVCVVLCFSVAFMVGVQGYSASSNKIVLEDSWGLDPDSGFMFGALTQIAPDGREYTYNITYQDSVIKDAIEDDIGRVGFLFEPFSKIPSGYTSEGEFILRFYIPWADYLPTDEDPWVVTNINVTYSFFLAYYTDSIGNYKKYSLTDVSASFKSGDDVLNSDLLTISGDKTYNILRFSGNYVSTQRELMEVEIRWKGKPSINNFPFISFEFNRSGTYMYASPVKNYYGNVNDKINSDLNEIKNGLVMDEPNVDALIDGLDPSIRDDAYLFRGSGKFYNFLASMAVVGVSIGSIGYILHGKKE